MEMERPYASNITMQTYTGQQVRSMNSCLRITESNAQTFKDM